MCCGLIIMLVWLVVCLHKLVLCTVCCVCVCVRVCLHVCVCLDVCVVSQVGQKADFNHFIPSHTTIFSCDHL